MPTSRTAIGFGLALCLLSGCSLPVTFGGAVSGGGTGKITKALNPMEWGAASDEPRSGTPERVVATWSDTVRQTMGQSAERGFGGRLYFYDRGDDPITVDGRLVVYAFEEDGRAPTDHKPTKRFIFPTDQLAKHMSVSELGPSYSVWLPWGSVKGTPTHISLIARFEPLEGGGLVVSDQARQRLPGQGIAVPEAGAVMVASKVSPNSVQQAGYQGSVAAPSAIEKPEEPRRRLSTTTIRLPK